MSKSNYFVGYLGVVIAGFSAIILAMKFTNYGLAFKFAILKLQTNIAALISASPFFAVPINKMKSIYIKMRLKELFYCSQEFPVDLRLYHLKNPNRYSSSFLGLR